MKPKILVTRKLTGDALAPLFEQYDVDVWSSEDSPIPRDELLQRAAGTVGILCMLTEKIDAELFDAAGPQLRAVSTMSVGADHIDRDEAERRGIAVGTTPGVLDDAVADLTVALMLNASRRIDEAAQTARNGQWSTWSPYWMTGQDLSQSTVGIVGLGAIGIAVAKRLKGFGCKVLYSGRTRKPELEQQFGLEYRSQDELLRESDFVTVHTALTSGTEGMCDDNFFTAMKPTAVFVNTGRGGLVDQEALYRALTTGSIYAAGIDVTTPEPLPTDNPLFSLPNLLILPHIGSASIKTRKKMADMAVQNIIEALQ